MSSMDEWHGRLAGCRKDWFEISMDAIISAESMDRGGSRPFHASADNGETYWVKQIENLQSSRVPVTEQIIAGCGQLIGAPVRPCSLMLIPSDFDGDMLMNGTVLRTGIAHASLHLDKGFFNKTWGPENRNLDDNRKRHAAYFAFFDWCWGDDRQWLYDTAADMMTWSHDHGHFLPGGPDWSTTMLQAEVNAVHPLDTSPEGLDYNELERVAGVLENMQPEHLVEVLCRIPTSWQVSDQELEAVGWFLDCRRLPVATRRRQLAATLAG
ncbi:MAG: hypothetical protein KDA81_18690 [Planctomycetaceae bacterium]|nr:hypothetical protein [Planctomycetaceae bacterium]